MRQNGLDGIRLQKSGAEWAPLTVVSQ